MSLGAHLREFRRRAVIAVAALVVGMIVAFVFTDQIIYAMTVPVRVVAAARGEAEDVGLMYQTVTGAFDMRLRMSFAVGIIISAPVWMWQLWAFLVPGLTRKEIRLTVGFMGAAVPLFAVGVFVGWLVMPHVVEVMASFTPEGAANWFDAKYYYDFVLKLLLVIGVSFVVPVFLVALNLAGIVSGKAILKSWRVAVVVAAVFAGLATPAADVISMLMLAGILIVLFFAAAGLSMLFDRRRGKKDPFIAGTPGVV
ncbi:MAG: twin-arginine translocase subunit TatC [Microbacterium sp.]